MLKFLPVLALCLLGAQAQKFNIGQCPSYDEQDNFDLKRFLGKWYEAQTYSHGYERNLKCVELDFTAGAKNNTMNLDIKWKDSRNNDGQIVDTAEMWYPGDFSSDMQIPMAPSFFMRDGGNYYVLGTDYETYAVVYACPSYQLVVYYLNYQNVWVLTRDRNPSQQVLKNAQEAFKRNTFLQKWRLRNSNQRGC
ncbi:hypothetical protein WA026_007747 [Henosepilachna vigintioctopunctata]|uniref:Lipocalin/cytosolic fatty-acid binding domain-containing protein n=1 Tax=Henosepilachna vigintioctopunctata TaxID=420089 RepID=A0AAW1U3X9_9CUCU